MYSEQLQKFIPPNFDLKNYELTANMKLIDWGRNIAIKSFLLDELENELRCDDLEEKITLSIKQGVIVNGFNTFPNEKDIESIANSDWADLTAVVRDLRAYEIRQKFSDYEITDECKDVLAVECIDSDQSNLAWVQVDLNCSDKEIVEAFSNWLIRARDKTIAPREPSKRRSYKLKKFSQPTLRKWHNARVLAYLDLITWNKLKKQKVSSYILGKLVFPEPVDIRDSTAIINDTVKPLVKDLTSKQTLDRIFKVSVEKSRKKTA